MRSPATPAIYARCSTAQQAERDESTIDTQIAEATRYCAQTLGCSSPRVYVDEARTGTNLSRPGWKQLLADAQAGLISTLVCTYRTRLGRGEAATVATYLLNEAGVPVRYVHEDFGGTRRDQFVRTTVDTLASGLYVEAIREATTTKMQEMVRSGYWTGGHPPVGGVTVPVIAGSDSPRRLIASPEAPAVVAVFEAFILGGRITDARTAIRRLLPGRVPDTIDATRRLLSRRAYRGELALGDVVNPNAHPPIVPVELFDRAQELLKGSGCTRSAIQSAGYKGAGEERYPLRGLVRCGSCGCLLTPGAAKGGRICYYECSAARKAGAGHPCTVGRVNADHLLQAILIDIRRLASSQARVRAILAAAREDWGKTPRGTQASERAKTVAKMLKEKDRQVADLLRRMALPNLPDVAVEAMGVKLAQIKESITALEAEQLEMQQRRRSPGLPTPERLQTLLGSIVEVWPHISPEDHRRLLLEILESVVALGPRAVVVRLKSNGGPLISEGPAGDKFAKCDDLGARFAIAPNNPPACLEFDLDLRRRRERSRTNVPPM